MAKVQIHVNRYIIAYNRKHNTLLPVFTVKQGAKNTYAHSVQINGPSQMVYRPCDPLSCGAVAWVEADNKDLVLENPIQYARIRESMELQGEVVEEAFRV